MAGRTAHLFALLDNADRLYCPMWVWLVGITVEGPRVAGAFLTTFKGWVWALLGGGYPLTLGCQFKLDHNFVVACRLCFHGYQSCLGQPCNRGPG